MADVADMAQETWQAMEKLVDQGLVRSIGISNFSIKKIKVGPGPHKLRKALLALLALLALHVLHTYGFLNMEQASPSCEGVLGQCCLTQSALWHCLCRTSSHMRASSRRCTRSRSIQSGPTSTTLTSA